MLLPIQLLLFFFPGSAINEFISRPPDQWKVLEGENITFLWACTLDGTILIAKFINVTGGTQITIAQNVGGSTSVALNFQKRFTADISVTQAKITMHAAQMSDDRNKFALDISTSAITGLRDEVELIVQCK